MKSSSKCAADASRIHQVQEIQGCGYVFVVQQENDIAMNPIGWVIVGASRNVETAVWVDVRSTSELRGKSIGFVFHGKSLQTVCTLLRRCIVKRRASGQHISLRSNRNIGPIHTASTKTRGEVVLPALLLSPENQRAGGRVNADTGVSDDSTAETITMSCTVSCSNPGWFVVEVEESRIPHQASDEPTSGLLEVARVLEHVPLQRNPQESVCELADAFIEKFPFDRVMVYRFEADNSGTVICESVRKEAVSSSYKGLRFPATDIPSSVRELLTVTGVRYIADTSAPGVPVDLLQKGAARVDLSMCSLKASTECHLTYLRNMGVKSSLVVAIVVDAKLWGLFSFHNYSAVVKLSSEERIMIEMATTVTSSLISYYQRDQASQMCLRLSRTLGNFSAHARIHSFLSAEYLSLLSILDVDTILLSHNPEPAFGFGNVVFGNGEVSLAPEECTALLADVRSKHAVNFASVEARGVAFFSVRSFGLWFVRGGVTTKVMWAGEPDIPLLDKERLHPRRSFEMFLEDSVGKVEPWSQATTDLLSMVRIGVSSFLYEEGFAADMRDRVAHISHELRTPFHGVMTSLDVLRAGHAHMNVKEREEIFDTAILCGTSMMSALDDILDITTDEAACNTFIASYPIHATVTVLKHFADMNAVELCALMSTAAAAAASTGPLNSTTGAVISAGRFDNGRHEVIGNDESIRQVLLNLVSNAIKFTPPEGKVGISLLVFDSLEEVTAWWSIETNRFDANTWIGTSPDTESVEDAEKSAGSAGAQAGEAGLPPRAPQRWYVYCVEDTGVGIPARTLSTITTAYTPVSEPTLKATQGIGFGLHICLIHVQAMRGRLGVASRRAGEGRSGTLFAVVFPLLPLALNLGLAESTTIGSQEVEIDAAAVAAQAEVAAAAITGARPDCGEGSGAPLMEVAIIVADDNVVNGKLMKKKIEAIFQHTSGRVKVLWAADGLAALEMLNTFQDGEADGNNAGGDETHARTTTVVAGFFMDYNMPNMDGAECTRRIRLLEAEKGWPRAFVCGFTADMSEMTRNRFVDAGAQGIVGKPFKTGQVEGACKAMLIDVLKRDGKKSILPASRGR